MADAINHCHTKNVVCPYCGYEDKDSWEYDGSWGGTACVHCGKKFNYERTTSVSFTTFKLENP